MNYLNYVNIKHGAKSVKRFSNGNTLPLVQRPFGFSSFAPQTSSDRGTWYYFPEDRCIEGIRLTHQPSPWIHDHSAMVIYPQSDYVYAHYDKRWSGIDPEKSILEPHYMKYFMKRSYVTMELTPTEYGACIRLDYERDYDNYLSVLPVHGMNEFKFDKENNVLYCSTTCNQLPGYDAGKLKGYFAFKFDSDIVDSEKTLIEDIDKNIKEPGLYIEGENTGIHLFLKKKKFEFSMATSFISYEQALRNLENDSTYADFDSLKAENEKIWNDYLGKVEITTDDEEMMKTFYSCLYRAFLFPHKAYELDENGNAIHYAPCDDTVKPGYRYTDNGFWDTYRTVYPFFEIVDKDKCVEMIEGYVQDYIDGGWLPCWTAGDAKKCMPSTAIDAVIADMAVKGLISGDLLKTAFEGMEKHANQDSDKEACGREGCGEYLKLGYVPCDKYKESVNLTLDAAYFDYCLAVVADILGYTDKKEKYLARAKNYANIFDKETGFMRPKDSNGVTKPNFDPYSWGGDYTEASAWQTSLAVQHDIEGLAELHGGKDEFIKKLDEFFDAPLDYRVCGYGFEIHEMTEMAAGNWGQCAISNQPSFHIPFMYAYLGNPDKTEYWVKRICEEGFTSADDGYPGDEDNGTMALWYVFSVMGFYPIAPGKDEYVKFKPLVDEVKILGKKIDLSAYDKIVTYKDIMDQIK